MSKSREEIQNFNPRLREGGDFFYIKPTPFLVLFQSTPPRRRRRRNCAFTMITIISIHASAKEATRYRRTKNRTNQDFNPRLREGGDQGSCIAPQ